jgi:hypothetical protein
MTLPLCPNPPLPAPDPANPTRDPRSVSPARHSRTAAPLPQMSPVTPLESTPKGRLVNVDSKPLTPILTPLYAPLTKNGEGGIPSSPPGSESASARLQSCSEQTCVSLLRPSVGGVLAAKLFEGEKQTRRASGRVYASPDASQKGLWPCAIDCKEWPNIFFVELEAN